MFVAGSDLWAYHIVLICGFYASGAFKSRSTCLPDTTYAEVYQVLGGGSTLCGSVTSAGSMAEDSSGYLGFYTAVSEPGFVPQHFLGDFYTMCPLNLLSQLHWEWVTSQLKTHC